jgi:hypothetical protein
MSVQDITSGINNSNYLSRAEKLKKKDDAKSTESDKSVSSSSDKISLSEEGLQMEKIFKQISDVKQSLSENSDAASGLHSNLSNVNALKLFDEEFSQNMSVMDKVKSSILNDSAIAGSVHQNLTKSALSNI